MGSAERSILEHPDDEEQIEYRKEGLTMALYVAICLLAAFAVLPEDSAEDHAIGLVWGTTIGLALAHWFAFRVAAKLVAQGAVRPQDALAAVAQLVGAAVVGVIATLPTLFLTGSAEVDGVIIILAAFIAGVGIAVARSGGAAWARSIFYGGSLLLAAGLVVIVKIVFAGH